MAARRIFALSLFVFVICLAVAFSPLTDGDTGWKNTVGDVVWTGMFVSLPVAIVAGIAAVTRKGQTSPSR